MGIPAYFLTWTTYGTWLPGDLRGWVSKLNNAPGTDVCPPSEALRTGGLQAMKNNPILLTPAQRDIIEKSINAQCQYRKWHLFAVNCRSNHIHVLLQALETTQQKVMNGLKTYATRALRKSGFFVHEKKIWTRSGSMRYLTNPEAIQAVIHYIENQ